MDYCHDRYFGIWGEGKIMEIIFPLVGFDGYIFRHFIYYDTSSILCISELELSFDIVFYVTLESNEVCGTCHHYRWWPSWFSGSLLLQ
jgi:hypothetical protein